MSRSAMVICTPIPFRAGTRVLEPVTVEWHRAKMSLGRPTCFNFGEVVADGMEVGEARNFAVEKALEAENTPEFMFWLDYDVLPQYDALTKLFYRARCFPEYDIIAGVYCSKGSPPEPLVYMDQGVGPYWDWAVGDLLFDVYGVHSGLTLVRTSLYRRMLEAKPNEPLYLTTNQRTIENGKLCSRSGTEDLWFCRRAVDDFGARIMVDTSVLAGHINNATGQIFGLRDDSPPIQRSHFMRRRTKDGEEPEDEKKALDIGAGGTRRQWEGYRTYTTDIRPETKPDYVMDTRLLNIPDGEFDLAASSHHLEHIGRWDQEKVWQEMSRVLKPGGRMEHFVPSLEWAAAHIMDGGPDESVYNVLYGAQEAQGYARDCNTHYFGYTRTVARAMAEEVAGLIDVEVKDWRDDERLGLNLVITGRKPEGGGDGES